MSHYKSEKVTWSRWSMIFLGALALAAAMSLPGMARDNAAEESSNEKIVRRWYAAWVNKDLQTFNALMADDFTFSSAAGDDHISKTRFKTQCWDSQAQLIDRVDLEQISIGRDDAFVKYLGHTKNGHTFRNVEYFRIRDGKVESLECYFGAEANFPSAVSNRPK